MNDNTTIYTPTVSYSLDRIVRQLSVIIEDIRLLRTWVDERLADSQLSTDKQISSTQSAIAELRGEIAGLRQDLKVLIRSVPTA